MKYLLNLVVFTTSSFIFAQSTTSEILKQVTEFYAGDQYDDRFLHGYNLSFMGGGTIQASERWAFQFHVASTPFISMDQNRKQMVQDYLRTQDYDATPLYFQSKANVSYIIRKSLVSSIKKGETIHRHRYTSLYAGYQFQQQSYFSNQGLDYYQTAITSDSEGVYVTGYRIQVAALGLRIATTRQRNNSTIRWIVNAGLLYGTDQLNCETILKNDGTAEKYRWDRDEFGGRGNLGFETGIQLLYYPKGHWGMMTGMEYNYTPLPWYRYRNNFFVPRGGTGIRQTAFAFKLGVAYRLQLR